MPESNLSLAISAVRRAPLQFVFFQLRLYARWQSHCSGCLGEALIPFHFTAWIGATDSSLSLTSCTWVNMDSRKSTTANVAKDS